MTELFISAFVTFFVVMLVGLPTLPAAATWSLAMAASALVPWLWRMYQAREARGGTG